MKKLILALGLLFAGASQAADLKIAHVDSKMIFDKYADTKKAQKEYDKQVQEWEQEAATKQKTLMELKEKLEKQSLMLSEEKKKEMEADFLKKKSEYEQFVQQIYGKDGALFQKNEEF